MLDKWDQWRQAFAQDFKDEDCGRFRNQTVRILPFLVSGYGTQKIKKKQQQGYGGPKTETTCYKQEDGQQMELTVEVSPVMPMHATFIGTIQKIVETAPPNIKEMFMSDGGRMVVPFIRTLDFVHISQELGISLPEIAQTDVHALFAASEWVSIFEKVQPDSCLVGDRFGYPNGRCKILDLLCKDQKSLASYIEHVAGTVAVDAAAGTSNDDALLLPHDSVDTSDVLDDPLLDATPNVRPPHFKVITPKPLVNTADSSQQHKCTTTCVFTYKGGEMKTTTAVNLAATLAKQGKKTCVVDGDGQCNLTSFFHPPFKKEDTTSIPYNGRIPSGLCYLMCGYVC